MKKTLLIATILLAGCTVGRPEQGDKIGQIAKVQTEGFVCSTVGILVTGKFGGGELHLTVPAALLKQVQHFNETQEFVKVTYHRDFMAFACSNDTNNRFLDSVESHPGGAPDEKK